MKKLVGLWIDHEKAVLVTLDGDGEKITTIESGAESHYRLSGGSRSATPYGPEEIVSEKAPEERRKHEFHRYYQCVMRSLQGAERIYILGPGEAPKELEKEIRRVKQLAPKLGVVRKADKMTERQIAAEVRKHFGITT